MASALLTPFLAKLQQLEDLLYHPLSETRLNSSVEATLELEGLREQLQLARELEASLSPIEFSLVTSRVQRLGAIASTLAAVDDGLCTFRKSILETEIFPAPPEQGANLVGKAYPITEAATTAEIKGAQATESPLNATIMRRWFLSHIEYPFPSTNDKQQLTEESNANGIGKKGQLSTGQVSELSIRISLEVLSNTAFRQCTLWFINARRRSGWTNWARRFACSDRVRLRAIVAAIQGRSCKRYPDTEENEEVEERLEELILATEELDRHLTKDELADLCRREFSKIVQWAQQGASQRVGDWMDSLVAHSENKPLLAKRRRAGELLEELSSPDSDSSDSDDALQHHNARHQRAAERAFTRQYYQQSCYSPRKTCYSAQSGLESPIAPPRKRTFRESSSPGSLGLMRAFKGQDELFSPVFELKEQAEPRNLQQWISQGGNEGQSPAILPFPEQDCHLSPASTPSEVPSRIGCGAGKASSSSSWSSSSSLFSHFSAASLPPWCEGRARELGGDAKEERAGGWYKESSAFAPPVTAAAAVGSNWGLPRMTTTWTSTRPGGPGRPGAVRSNSGWLSFVGQGAQQE